MYIWESSCFDFAPSILEHDCQPSLHVNEQYILMWLFVVYNYASWGMIRSHHKYPNNKHEMGKLPQRHTDIWTLDHLTPPPPPPPQPPENLLTIACTLSYKPHNKTNCDLHSLPPPPIQIFTFLSTYWQHTNGNFNLFFMKGSFSDLHFFFLKEISTPSFRWRGVDFIPLLKVNVNMVNLFERVAKGTF